MKRKGFLPKLLICLLAMTVIVALPALPAFAEEEPGDPEPEPVAFTATGLVVAYDLPGVTTATEADAEFLAAVLGEDEGDGTDGTEGDEGDGNDGTEGDEGDGNDGTEGDENDGAEGEDPVIEGPYITLVNDDGEFTFAVAEDFTIDAPLNEDGDYVLNVGDEAEVSGFDDLVDSIIVTPAVSEGGERSLCAAVPGVVVSCEAFSIVIDALDGFTYRMVLTEDTPVYAGPLTLDTSAISAGDLVVVKGDGLGGAEWIRFIGQSMVAVRNTHQHRILSGEAVGVDDDGPGGRGKGVAHGMAVGRDKGLANAKKPRP